MNLVEPEKGRQIPGVEVPAEVYWVLESPTPLAGMRYPRESFPWPSVKKAGFSKVVSLHPASYDPMPLELCFSEALEDLVRGGPPRNPNAERAKIQRAVDATISALRSGHGVVVDCLGGRGRTGTVLGCVLRKLGVQAADVIEFFDGVHRVRRQPGWPESRWQRELVEH